MSGAILLKTVRPEPVSDWIAAIHRFDPGREVRVWPDFGRREDIDYALVCKMPQSEKWLGRDVFNLPNLKLMATVNAGIEFLLDDPELPPGLPIVRAGSTEGDPMMTETVVMHVLRHHRRMHDYAQQQRDRVWARLPETPPSRHVVGFMGFGAIARPAAPLLQALGFRIAAWTRRPRSEPGIACHSGAEGLKAFLAESDIVVMLLPLTAETENVIDAQTLALMKPGTALINLARGKHVDEAALLAALDSGQVSAATLDVFRTEPLPQESPFWHHPRVTVMPHTARRVSADTIVPQLMDAIRRFEAGEPLVNLADRQAGY